MPDKYHVYRPLLDLIGHSEGTDKGRGYDETLAYGAYTGGPVVLTTMTLDQVDALQTRMLQHPKNALNSSAAGRYQIIRTTLRAIREQLGLTGRELFDHAMQDRLACFLLGQRGIDKYLAGRLSEATLIANLAKEWASLPTPEGTGHYKGQHAAVTPARVRAVLAEVRARHQAGQPGPKETVPETVDEKVKQETTFLQKITGFLTGAGGLGGLVYGLDWQAIVAIIAAGMVVALVILLLRRQIVSAVREIRAGLS